MKKFLLGITLMITASAWGCTSQYQYQVDQSLLLQENRRLENALYVTHAQLVDLKRENDVLRTSSGSGKSKDSSAVPLIRSKRAEAVSHDDYDEAPPFAPPEINIPNGVPGSSAIPDTLKGSKIVPPNKKYLSEKSAPHEIVFPTLSESEEPPLPAWSPTR